MITDALFSQAPAFHCMRMDHTEPTHHSDRITLYTREVLLACGLRPLRRLTSSNALREWSGRSFDVKSARGSQVARREQRSAMLGAEEELVRAMA